MQMSGSAVWLCEDVMGESGNEIIKHRMQIQQARKLSNATKKRYATTRIRLTKTHKGEW